MDLKSGFKKKGTLNRSFIHTIINTYNSRNQMSALVLVLIKMSLITLLILIGIYEVYHSKPKKRGLKRQQIVSEKF